MRRSLLTAAAAAFLVLPAGVAAAAPGYTTGDLNMRTGPGTGYGVITAIPAGSAVEVFGCTGNWCEVAWNGYEGYSSGSYLDIGGEAYGAAPPAAVVVAPPAYYGPRYYGPRYYGPRYYGPRYTPAERALRRGVRTLRHEIRRDRRQDRREDRREARQDRREDRRDR